MSEYRRLSDGETAGPPDGSELDKLLSADPAWEQVDDAPVAAPAPEPDLSDLNRDELNRLATEKGIEDAAQLPNKGVVVAAIEAAENA